MKDINLMKKALSGNEEATRQYCGSYKLTEFNGKLFRIKFERMKQGMKLIEKVNNEKVYDSEGFLISKYWSLPRL